MSEEPGEPHNHCSTCGGGEGELIQIPCCSHHPGFSVDIKHLQPKGRSGWGFEAGWFCSMAAKKCLQDQPQRASSAKAAVRYSSCTTEVRKHLSLVLVQIVGVELPHLDSVYLNQSKMVQQVSCHAAAKQNSFHNCLL